MVLFNANECRLSNQMLVAILVGAVSGLLLALASGLLVGTQITGAISFIIIFSLLGVVGMLNDISILKCPTRILVGAAGFITLTAILDAYVF
ncbi:MAG TPA: hypothetical protein ENK26_05490 [Gammaproteobacteria bacterium]|nr:hypothetical protein [Gammaproteobacteria bacterium]